MRSCKQCGEPTDNPKFCSVSCSTTYNNKKRSHQHTDDEFIYAVEISKSLREVGRILSIGYESVVRNIDRLNISTSHFTGCRVPPEEYLKIYPRDKRIDNFKLKSRLYRDGFKEEKCEICGIETWQGGKIGLQLHHKDGDKWNNVLDNLQILCPNCHSQTDTWCTKNIKR